MAGGSRAEGWQALAERDFEREAIERALAECVLGRGRIVLLYGPSGMGRSSLLRAAVADAALRDITVLEASGSELERGYGFGVVRQLLESQIAKMTAAQRRAILDDAGPAAESALGIGRVQARGANASFDQTEGVYRLVSALASEKPILVAVDDLQWSDRPSLDFLCFLGHRVPRLPVCIVAAWRRGEPGVRAGRLQALAGSPDTVFLTPAPLTRDGIRAVVRAHGEGDADDGAVAAIHAQTGGQPFLVSELVAGLRLRGLPATAGHREAIAAVTPESVRRNVAARLGRHPEPVRRFAQAAAVLGDASLGQTAALAAIDTQKARGVADALARAGIIRDDPAISFSDPLLRTAVYGTLSSLECAALHQRAAVFLLDMSSSTDAANDARVAEHLLRSEPAGLPRFREVLLTVAETQASAGALRDAQRLLHRALAEIDDDARGETLARLAEIELGIGDPVAAVRHATEALALELTATTHTAACLAAAHGLALTQGPQAALALLDAESDRLPQDAGAQLEVQAAAAVVGGCTGALQDATVGAHGTLLGATAAERVLLAVRASELLLTGTASARAVRDLCARALAQHDSRDVAANDSRDVAANDSRDVAANDSRDVAANDSRDVAANDSRDVAANDSRDVAANDSRDVAANDSRDVAANDSRDVAANDSRDVAAIYFAGASALHVDAEELVEGLSERDLGRSAPRELTMVGLALRSQLALARGELSQAEADACAVLTEIEAAPHSLLARRVRADSYGVLVLAAVARGRGDAAQAAFADLAAHGEAPNLTVSVARIAAALAQSNPPAALEAIAQIEHTPIGVLAPGLSWRPWAALAYHADGQSQAAVAVAAAHLDHARWSGGRSLLGVALTVRGLVEPDDGARVTLLEEAVAVLRSTPAALALAGATIELGSTLRRLGRRRDAHDCLVRGADLAHRCGAETLSARALAELVSVGARPRRAAFSGVGALTASEHRVAVLAAAGMTNREIAQRLTVSTKTVSGQLTAVYRKLDVHDRVSLVATMAEATAGADSSGDRSQETIG